MPRKTPVGGRGSNQYVTRGASTRSAPRRSVTAIAEAATDHDPEAVAWAFNPERTAWEALGLSSWAEVSPWRDNGFTAQDTGAWMNQGFKGTAARYAARWRDSGFKAFYAGQWLGAGFTDPAEARTWSEVFSVRAAEFAFGERQAGKNPEKIRGEWTAAGFDTDDIHMWAANGWTDPVEAKAWAAAGFGADEEWIIDALEWRDEGVEPTEAFGWYDNNITIGGRDYWRKQGHQTGAAAFAAWESIEDDTERAKVQMRTMGSDL